MAVIAKGMFSVAKTVTGRDFLFSALTTLAAVAVDVSLDFLGVGVCWATFDVFFQVANVVDTLDTNL